MKTNDPIFIDRLKDGRYQLPSGTILSAKEFKALQKLAGVSSVVFCDYRSKKE